MTAELHAMVEPAAFEAVSAWIEGRADAPLACDLVRVDERARRWIDSIPRDAPYATLSEETWADLLPEHGTRRSVLVAIGTMHRTGYIRQRALGELALRDDGFEVAFALLRVTDWVDPVRGAALRLIRERLVHGSVDGFVRALPLVERMRRLKRRPTDAFFDAIDRALSSPDALRFLERELDASDRILRRLALVRLLEGADETTRRRVVRRAMFGDDLGARLRAMHSADEDPELRLRMSRDASGAIRTHGLRVRVERGECEVSELREALFDPISSVRSVARWSLRGLDPAFDVAETYRSELTFGTSTARLRAAAAGLSEVGSRDDAAYVVDRIGSPRPSLALEAVRATAKLDPDGCRDELLAALRHPWVDVARAAARALRTRYVPLPSLCDLMSTDAPEHAARFALQLVRAEGPWERLADALDLSRTFVDRYPVVVDDWVRTWVLLAERGRHVLPPVGEATARRVTEGLACVRDDATRERILRCLSSRAL